DVRTGLDPVDGVAPDGNLGRVGRRRIASALQPVREPRDAEVVPVRRLIVDEGDGAGRAGAERVLDGRVGVAPGADQNVPGGFVRGALDLIKGPRVRGVERADGAVGGSAGRVRGLIDVARSRRAGARAPAGGRAAAGSDRPARG